MRVEKGMNYPVTVSIDRRGHILEIFRRESNVGLGHSLECRMKDRGKLK